MKTLKQIREGYFKGGRVTKLGMRLPDKDGKSAKWVGSLPKIGYKIGVEEHQGKPWPWEKGGGGTFIPGAWQGDPLRKIKGDNKYDPGHWQAGGKHGPSRSAEKELWLICKDEDEAQDICDEILGSIMDIEGNNNRLQGSTIGTYEIPINKNNETSLAKGAEGPFNICAIFGTKEHLKEILKRSKWPQPDGYSPDRNPIPSNVRSQGLKDLRKAGKPKGSPKGL